MINQLRTETDAKIRVEDAVKGCEERIVMMSATDNGEEWSPAQEALMRVYQRISEGDGDAAMTTDEEGEIPSPTTTVGRTRTRVACAVAQHPVRRDG